MDFFTYQPMIILAIFAIASIFHGLTGIGVTLIATTALASGDGITNSRIIGDWFGDYFVTDMSICGILFSP